MVAVFFIYSIYFINMNKTKHFVLKYSLWDTCGVGTCGETFFFFEVVVPRRLSRVALQGKCGILATS